ncbi:hypothetical protein AB0L49_19690 [Streptomyces antimycoticus]|uniref:hypothetical protein n=1 Tax=Streptomyces antimycoticus TaxID=68175 RepID=UPI00342655E5
MADRLRGRHGGLRRLHLTHHDPRLARLALSVRDDGEDQALLGAVVFAARAA